MSTNKQKRKRTINSCTQCYSKKQKCNHQYPCNHCTLRRRPELCSYELPEPTNDGSLINVPSVPLDGKPERVASKPRKRKQSLVEMASKDTTNRDEPLVSSLLSVNSHQEPATEANLLSCFGYFEASKTNLWSLMRGFGLLSNEEIDPSQVVDVPKQLLPDIKACFNLLPKRRIVDCLVQHFLKEVNWIYELVHSSNLLTRYESWWTALAVNQIEEVEFCVLLLRICAYSAQFLPSRAYTADTICGVSITSIREHCSRVASGLSRVYESTGGPRSLTGVQHLSFAACYLMNEGRMKEAWYVIGDAIRLAQDLGMHLEVTAAATATQSHFNDLEKEMRRRAFWNLYIWDRFLSLALDRLPCIPDEFCTVAFPKMRLAPGIDDFNAPDVFSERLLQARLTKNWYTVIQLGNTRTSVYDPGAAEEQYESLRRDFVFSLPDVFALIEPNKDWDSQLPMLVRQRQMLRISIFALLCQLFRPLLQLSASQMEDMLQYKQDLVLTHRDHLLRAAISLLDSISCLHELMGDNQNRFFLLSFYTFEPAMLLGMHLLSFDSNKKTSRQARAPNECKDFWKSTSVANDANMAHIDVTSHYQCRVHIDKALKRLNMLREVSAIADLGARKLDQVTAKLNMQSPSLPNDQENSISFKGREPVRSPGQVPRNQQTERMGSWMDLDTTQHDPSATASLKKIAPVTPWIGDLSEDSLESLVFAAPWPTHQPDDWNAYWSPINNASVNARSDSSRASFASNATLGLGSEGSSAGSSQYSMFHNPPIESLEPLGTSSNSEPETSSRLLPLNIAMQKHQDHPDPPQSGGTDAGNRWDTFFSNLPNGLLENSM